MNSIKLWIINQYQYLLNGMNWLRIGTSMLNNLNVYNNLNSFEYKFQMNLINDEKFQTDPEHSQADPRIFFAKHFFTT